MRWLSLLCVCGCLGSIDAPSGTVEVAPVGPMTTMPPPPPGPTLVDGAKVYSSSFPPALTCSARTTATVTFENTGTSTWTSEDCSLSGAPLPVGTVAPGAKVTFQVPLQAPATAGPFNVKRQLQRGGTPFGEAFTDTITVNCSGGCSFPAGVPDPDFIGTATSNQDTDAMVDAAVNSAMQSLTGCPVGSSCPLGAMYPGARTEEQCAKWFEAVNAKLREQGLCAGLHEPGSDEIAVSNTGCTGKWYGYHVCFYGGPSVVWNPGARRGWWKIAPARCP